MVFIAHILLVVLHAYECPVIGLILSLALVVVANYQMQLGHFRYASWCWKIAPPFASLDPSLQRWVECRFLMHSSMHPETLVMWLGTVYRVLPARVHVYFLSWANMCPGLFGWIPVHPIPISARPATYCGYSNSPGKPGKIGKIVPSGEGVWHLHL